VTSVLRLSRVFIARDLRVEASYKAGLALRVLAGLLTVLLFYFVAEVLHRAGGAALAEYGGYFPFVVVGLAFLAYVTGGVSAVASGARESQASGVLELLVVSPVRPATLVVCASLPGYVFGLLTLVVFLLTAGALGVDYSQANIALALTGLAVATPSSIALGLFAVALVFVTRRGNPVAWAMRAVSILLAGVLYPIDVLPGGLRALSQAIPLTHALEIERGALLLGQGFAELWQELAVLAAMAAVLLPLGLAACRVALGVARNDGSLRS
jgi:ABC-2 type transport system permease protein